jgi:hypothetical protein
MAFLLAFSIGNSQAQTTQLPVDPDTKLITYKEIVNLQGTKNELFNRAIAWINKEYKNPVEVTKVRSPESGLIEISHRIEISSKTTDEIKQAAGFVDYSFKLEMKDGRYRYIVSNFVHRQASRFPAEKWLDTKDPSYNPQSAQYLSQIDDFTKKLIASLKQGMLPQVQPKKDEW